MSKNIIINLLLFLLIITFNYSCNPDIADSPSEPSQLSDKEIIDTLNNKMVFTLDGQSWVSDNSSRAFYRDGGVEIIASKWTAGKSVVETQKLFIYLDNQELQKTNYVVSKLEVYDNDNLKINFGQYRIYPYSSPTFNTNYNSQVGNIQIIDFNNNFIAGKFNLELYEFPSDTSNIIKITKGYFKINVIN